MSETQSQIIVPEKYQVYSGDYKKKQPQLKGYQDKSNFTTPKLSKSELEQAKQMLLSHNKKKEIAELAAAVKKELQDQGADVNFQGIVKEYEQNDPRVINAIQKYEKGLDGNATAKQLGMTYDQRKQAKDEQFQAELEVIQTKFGFLPTSENLAKFRDWQNVPSDISNKKLRELMILDDWATIAAVAMPFIQQYGKKAIDYLWEKYVGNKTYKEQDWGGPSIDQGLNPTREMWKIARVPGLTYDGTANQPIPRQNFQISDQEVNLDYIRCVLLPEHFSSRQVSLGYAPSMVVQSSLSVPLVTTATGTGYVVVNSDQANVFGGTGLADAFVVGNPATYDPATGATTVSQYYPGPLTSVTNLMSFRTVGFSVQFVPTLSQNSATGSVSICSYYALPGYIYSGTNVQQILSSKSMQQQTTFATGNMNTTYRQAINITQGQAGVWNSNNAAAYNTNVSTLISVSGAPPSVQIGTVYIYFVYEVRYLPFAVQFTQQAPCTYSPSTLECLQIIGQNESHFMQSANDIKKVLMPTTVPGFKGTVKSVLQLLNSAASTWNVQRSPGAGVQFENIMQNVQGNNQKQSFDYQSDNSFIVE